MLSIKFPHLFIRPEIIITFLWGWEWSGGAGATPLSAEFCFFFFDFILLKKHFGGREVKFTPEKCKASYPSFIFLYALLALKVVLSRRVANILHCSVPDTGHEMAVVNFNGLYLAVYCIFVI